MNVTVDEGADNLTLSNNCSLFKLPDHVVFRIFSNLPLRERGMAMRTCKWMDLCGRESWRSVKKALRLLYTHPGSAEPCPVDSTYMEDIFDQPAVVYDSLCVTVKNENSFIENLFPQIGSNLVQLLTGLSHPWNEPTQKLHTYNDWIEKIIAHCPNLKTLCVDAKLHRRLTTSLGRLGNLENLSAYIDDMQPDLPKDDLNHMFSQFNKMKRVILCGDYGACLLSLPAPHLLTHLVFHGYFSEHLLIDFIPKCPNLLHCSLSTSYDEGWSANVLQTLGRNCKRIEVISLSVSGVNEIPDSYEGNRDSLKSLMICCHINGDEALPDPALHPLSTSLGPGVVQIIFKDNSA